jgi:hypothetical protein
MAARAIGMAVIAYGTMEACTRTFACDNLADGVKDSGVCSVLGKR